MKTKLFGLIFLVWSVDLQAQQVIATAGNFNSNTSGSISWTLGEGMIETYTGTSMVLTQGFQQSTKTTTVIQSLTGTTMEFSVYPNPTSDYVSFKTTWGTLKDLRLNLYDVYGKLLLDHRLEGNESKISFSNFAPGVYLLKLFSKDKELKAFKIVKN